MVLMVFYYYFKCLSILFYIYRGITGHGEEKNEEEALWHIGEIFQLLPFGFLFNWFKASFNSFSAVVLFCPTKTHVI